MYLVDHFLATVVSRQCASSFWQSSLLCSAQASWPPELRDAYATNLLVLLFVKVLSL